MDLFYYFRKICYICKKNYILLTLKHISIKRIHIRERSFLRKRRKYNRVHRAIRILRACRPRYKCNGHSHYEDYKYYNSLEELRLSAPIHFELYKTPEEVVNFINDSKNKVAELNFKCRIFFDLSVIKFVDNGGIGLLLCLVNYFAKHKVQCYGNLPTEPTAKQNFENLGFFEHVKSLQGKMIGSNDRFIVQGGSSTSENALIGREIRKIMKHLTGTPGPFKPLYSLIGEMVSNSIEHANRHKQDKNWLLSIHYDNKKVVVMVIDIGLGILATLRKKLRQKFYDAAMRTSTPDTLYNLFDRKYQSSTFEPNRNQGLPLIKDYSELKYISNLSVITNGVLLDFDKKKYQNLNTNLQGTFYYFEFSQINIDSWKNRIA